MIKLKRAYDEVAPDDGIRILVERLWPRGLTKEKAQIDLWIKEVAPSTELRKWFGHDPVKWDLFRQRYREELKSNQDVLQELQQKAQAGTVTFIYSSRAEQHNAAVALKEFLERT